MLSYRHSFHAGNHADVIKHIILIDVIKHLEKKETPLTYIDTHAGAGIYSLNEGYAAINKEWDWGFEKLHQASKQNSAPLAVQTYVDFVINNQAGKNLYLGSPKIASKLLRSNDVLVFFELHSTDFEVLKQNFSQQKSTILCSDGFLGLKGYLPPISRRGIIFIDPSYEIASDYTNILAALHQALKRFLTGVYIIWYPILDSEESKSLPDNVISEVNTHSCNIPILTLELCVKQKISGKRGMVGSGVVVINPPWPLTENMSQSLPFLVKALAQDEHASYKMKTINF